MACHKKPAFQACSRPSVVDEMVLIGMMDMKWMWSRDRNHGVQDEGVLCYRVSLWL